MDRIPFNRPFMTGKEIENIRQAHGDAHLSGDGGFTGKCSQWLEAQTGSPHVLLTHSCTAALEMAAILADIQPGDEVIMPSYTFVSTANAFVLRGGVPVFVDIREDTLNLDERLIEQAVTPKTRAIVPVHYAGVGCEMDAVMSIAEAHRLLVIEDAAQGVMSGYRGRPLGAIGHLGCYSFHETKNIISGEGGALLVNDEQFIERAEIIREKGTNRKQYFRGKTDKYTWCDIGSSYLPSDLIAAFLFAQLEQAEWITAQRIAIWERYHALFEDLEAAATIRRPLVPGHCMHNAHMFYLQFNSGKARDHVLQRLNQQGVNSVFHYVPLHSSPAGQKYGRAASAMRVTDHVASTLLRMPFWLGLTQDMQDRVAEAVAISLEDL